VNALTIELFPDADIPQTNIILDTPTTILENLGPADAMRLADANQVRAAAVEVLTAVYGQLS
jgi:hypothetical protein